LNLGKDIQPRSETRPEELNNLIVDSIQDVKGHEIIELDLRSLDEASTDYFIVCHGESHTQVAAIANKIIQKVKQETGISPVHTEGISNASWVLVDYFDTIVHIFFKETRQFYQIEELWSDAVAQRIGE